MKELFQYLIKKENISNPPFKVKLTLNMPLTKGELHIDKLDLEFSKDITKLPDGLHISRWLDIGSSNVEELPEGLYVGGNLWIKDNYIIEKLPRNMVIGWLTIAKTNITELPDDMFIKYDIYVDEEKLDYFQQKYPKYKFIVEDNWE